MPRPRGHLRAVERHWWPGHVTQIQVQLWSFLRIISMFRARAKHFDVSRTNSDVSYAGPSADLITRKTNYFRARKTIIIFFSNVLLTYMSINIYYKVLETSEFVRETSKCFARARNIEIMRGKLQSWTWIWVTWPGHQCLSTTRRWPLGRGIYG